MGKKQSQIQRDYTMTKHAFLAGMITLAVIFGPFVRGALFKSSSTDSTDRILRLEIQNGEHARLAEQYRVQAAFVAGLQQAQAKMVVQVKNLAEVVNAMQQREFARLEERHNGL